MSIQRAEDLKREWTDKFVTVQKRVPELRRFEGLVGQVKTVNMNCRLLVEFDTPADISWYDIDPGFVTTLEPEEAKTLAEASKATTEPIVEKSATKPKSAVAAKPAAGGSPLDAIRGKGAVARTPARTSTKSSPFDAIRAQSGSAAASESSAAKPAAAGSPLDAIRAQGAAAAADKSPAAKSTTTGSPLDAIRTQGGAATADKTPAAKSTATGSPLDQIRAQTANTKAANDDSANDSDKSTTEQGSASTSSPANVAEQTAKPQASPTSQGASPLDQIRSAAGQTNDEATTSAAAASSGATGVGATAAGQESPKNSSTEASSVNSGHQPSIDDAPQPNPPDAPDSAAPGNSQPIESSATAATLADAAGAGATGGGAAAVASAVGSDAANQASSDELSSSNATPDRSTIGLMNTPSTDANTTDFQSSLSHLEQIREQAAEGLNDNRNQITQQTLFDQVSQQASEQSESSTEKTSSDGTDTEAKSQSPEAPSGDTDGGKKSETTTAIDSAAAGVENPVQQTYKGKKLPKKDDLKIVEGIGPKIEELCHNAGIQTWQQLAKADVTKLQKVLEDAGPRFRMHSPETWPRQAELADAGQWQELEEYQDFLDGGRVPD